MRTGWPGTMLGVVLLVSACGSGGGAGSDGPALLDEAAAAMGGWEALEAIERQELVAQGSDWDPVQAVEPGGEMQTTRFTERTLIDYGRPALRIEFDAQRSFPAPGPVRFTEIIDGDAGAVLIIDAQGQGTASRMPASRRATRLRDLRRTPRELAFVARDAGDLRRVEDRTVDGQLYEVLQYTDDGSAVELLIHATDKLPRRVIYLETDPLYGDVRNERVFADWREAPGAAGSASTSFPYQQTLVWDGERLRDEVYESVVTNGTIPETAFEIAPEVLAVAEAGEPVISQWIFRRAFAGLGAGGFAESGQAAPMTEVAPGVYHITGGSHHSMAVEMADHVIVVETPLYEERSLAVIQAIEQQIPNKPIRYAVVTHFHMDHSGGIRTFAANGATVLGHESIVPWLQTVLSRPSTVRPDALAQAAGLAPTVEGVGDVREITDGTRTLQLRHVPNGHATGMLIAYLPAERIAFVSDLYSPPAPVAADNANARAFYDAVQNANLQVDQVLGGHGTGPGPYQALASVMSSD